MWLPLKNLMFFILIPTHVALILPYLSQLDQQTSHVVSEICMWFPKQHDSLSKPRNLFSKFTVCGFEMTCWALCGSEITWACGFEICLYILDRTARNSTCRGSFGGFKTTCFQLDQPASFKTIDISYFSWDRTSVSLVRAGSDKLISSKNWGGGKIMHSVLEGSPLLPIWTSRPRRAK